MNDASQRAQAHPCDDRQGDFADHLARVTGDDRRAENPVRSLLDVDLHEAHLLVVGDRTIDVVHRDGEGLHRNVPLARLPHIEADVSDLRVGISAPGNRQRAQPLATGEERVLNRDARRGVGGIVELVLQAGVAGGIDARIAGPQEIIDVDAVAAVVVDAGSLQIQTVDIRHTAGAGEDGIDGDRAVVVVTDEIDDLLAAFHAYVDGAGVEPYLDAIAREGIGQYLRGVALFLGQEQRSFLHDDRLHAETAKRLRHFAAERAATDDQQAARQLGQVEDVLVGQIAGFDETGNRGRVRPRASGDQCLFEAQCRAIHRRAHRFR